ncbi:MAG: DNA-binding domain-containing protein [Pirellulales bacterium]|nr:DNA-binding domain-containing protein [Pirellulales bacterium]
MQENKEFDLEKLQTWMQVVISHAGGIEAGIASEEAQREFEIAPDSLERIICRSNNLTSTERLGIYGNAYFARLLECLRESFPALAYALGDELFDEFSLEYLQRYPSQSYSLCELGGHFASHLQETRPDAEQRASGEIDWPDFLIDLATLEWNIEQVFDGPGTEGIPSLAIEQIEAVPPEQWSQMILRPGPSLRILEFQFPVNDYYTEFRQENKPEMPAPRPQYIALNRREYVVRRLEIEPLEYRLLERILCGNSLGDVIQRVAAEAEVPLEQFAELLQQWFQKWTTAQFFSSISSPQAETSID